MTDLHEIYEQEKRGRATLAQQAAFVRERELERLRRIAGPQPHRHTISPGADAQSHPTAD